MCCSVTPNVVVEFSKTVLYGAEIKAKDEVVHVLGYQNVVANSSQSFWQVIKPFFFSLGKTGNAMLLPFPAVPKTMTQANVLNTENCKDVLQDIARAVRTPDRSFESQTFGAGQSASPPKVQVFEAAGVYTVVLAQDARDIPDALNLVPREKRPALNYELFETYSEWYPNWTFALCCFNNQKAKLADPLVWWYSPMNPEQLFLPTLDSHNGKVPELTSNVKLDHTIAVGSFRREEKVIEPMDKVFNSGDSDSGGGKEISAYPNFVLGNKPRFKTVYYTNEIAEELKPYFLPEVMGKDFNTYMPNGDFVFQLDDVRKKDFIPERFSP